ncbi:hypothetical protein GCM10023168_29080 [Fodinibacter luteus]|uniref:Aromatic acid exporter family member 1 n=1 Tax=Fodinibacter luteus TaxID=552064 RepID=A0ABP8KN60_9MICO
MVSREVEVVDARGLPSRVIATLGGWAAAVRAAFTTPGVERAEGLLLLKAAVATVLAWQLAVHLLDSPVPFYAPMAALLVVDRTMVRSIGASARRVAAVVLGMSIAWLVGSLVGVTWWTMVPVLMVALLIGRWPLLGDHGIQVPTMVLLSLLTVQGTDTEFTYLTIVQTVLGGVVGVAVNAVVLAPMHLDQPRDALRDLTTRVQDVLKDMADGMRGTWDADRARGWYDTATDLGDRVPEVLGVVETGRESTRFNWRHRLRPARIDWDGYLRTVEAVRRAQWQVGGIARTLVDTAEDADRHPAPSANWLERYAGVLDEVGDAISDFGVWTDESREAVERHVERALDALHDLSEQVRRTPLDDPRAWPTYGALVLEAERLARELRESNAHASVPTDTGPIRTPLAETVPAVAQLQQQVEQVPLVGEHLPRIIGQVVGREPEDPAAPPPPDRRSDGALPS